MPLEPIALPDLADDLPSGPADAFIREAERRIADFEEARAHDPIRHFIPSDYAAVHAALRHLLRNRLVTGRQFCEWGCGFGVVAGLAELEGCEAVGIEIEPDLAEAARALLADFGLGPTILEGSYIPSGYGLFYDAVGDSRQLVADGSANPLYDQAGLEVADFDLVFVYPWPGEAQMVEELFEATAADGAILLLYHGLEDLQAFRLRME